MKKHVKTVKERKDQVFNRECGSEVKEWEDSEEGEEEEEEIKEQPEVLEEIPWVELKREMGSMNRTLDEMQAQLAIDPYEGSFKEDEVREVGLEPEDSRWMVMNGSRDPSVRDLQLNNLRIRRQLDALIRCSELGDGRILALDRLYSRQQKG